VCYRYGAWVTGGLVVVAMVAEVIVKPDLAAPGQVSGHGAVKRGGGYAVVMARAVTSSSSGMPPVS
ncbi:hypothetical protein ABZX29_39275, partial [Streptomyces zhihengii]